MKGLRGLGNDDPDIFTFGEGLLSDSTRPGELPYLMVIDRGMTGWTDGGRDIRSSRIYQVPSPGSGVRNLADP